MMEIGNSFSYQFEDKQWISKLGLAALITFVPILNFAVSGYMIGVMRNVMAQTVEPLPNWDDLEKKFIDGLILVAARLIYLLPFFVIFLPIGIIAFSSLVSGNNNLQSVGKLMAGAGSVLLVCLLCFIVIYSLALSVIFPAIEVLFAREGTFTSCFKFRQAFDIVSRNAGPFFTAWIVYVGVGFGIGLVIGVINFLVSWIPCIGFMASLVMSMGSAIYLLTISAHLFGKFGLVAFGENKPVG